MLLGSCRLKIVGESCMEAGPAGWSCDAAWHLSDDDFTRFQLARCSPVAAETWPSAKSQTKPRARRGRPAGLTPPGSLNGGKWGVLHHHHAVARTPRRAASRRTSIPGLHYTGLCISPRRCTLLCLCVHEAIGTKHCLSTVSACLFIFCCPDDSVVPPRAILHKTWKRAISALADPPSAPALPPALRPHAPNWQMRRYPSRATGLGALAIGRPPTTSLASPGWASHFDIQQQRRAAATQAPRMRKTATARFYSVIMSNTNAPLPKRFAPLGEPYKPDAQRRKLQGIVFDVDGTLW